MAQHLWKWTANNGQMQFYTKQCEEVLEKAYRSGQPTVRVASRVTQFWLQLRLSFVTPFSHAGAFANQRFDRGFSPKYAG